MICLFLLTLTNVGTTFSRNVNVAVLLPFDDDRLFSLKQIVPAITLAIDEINNRTDFLLNKMTVRYADTKCDIAYGINHAIEFYMKGQVDAFFGPVCDFAVAPVARQVQFWNLPMISGGAMARDFFVYKDTTYGMLTRVGPVNFQTLSLMFGKILNHYKWNRLKLLYESSGQDYIVTGFCHLLTEALHYDLLTVYPQIEQDYFRLDEGVDMDYILAREIGHHYSHHLMNPFIEITKKMDKTGNRTGIKYLPLKGLTPTHSNMFSTLRGDAPSFSIVEWTAELRRDREIALTITNMVMADRRLTTLYIISVVDFSHERVEDIISSELGMAQDSEGLVQKLLTVDQKRVRFQTSHDNLFRFEAVGGYDVPLCTHTYVARKSAKTF